MRSYICLIRHGKTVGNVQRLYYGSTDVPLADEGVEELKKLIDEGIYPQSDVCQIFTTGLTRTLQTKELIYGESPYGIVEDLREINFGEFEMKSYEQLLENSNYRDWITAEALDKAPPGGESIREFNHRVIRGYETVREIHWDLCLKHREQAGDSPLTVVICHGGTISAIMDHVYPGVHDNMYGWIPEPGHGYLLVLEEEEIADCRQF